jgi:integrase
VYKRGRIWYVGYAMPDGRYKYESSGSTNKRFAEKLESIRRAEIAEGRLRLPKSKPPRFGEWSARFLESVRHPNTRRRYRSSVRNLLAHFKEVRLSQVTAELIEKFKEARLKSGIRTATVNRDLAVLRRMLKLAARQRLISYNPLDEVDFLEERKERRQPHILSFQEQGRLMTVASALIRVLVVLLTEAGLRVNKEALALKWEQDVDFLDDVIHVRQSKTPAGRRNIPMSGLLREELLYWKELTGARSEYVFPNPRSSTGHLRVVRKTWATTLKLAGIPYFPIYNLRATFASRLSAAGAPDNFVAQMLGHSASSSILQTYAKAVDEYRRDAIRRLEAFRESRTDSSVTHIEVDRRSIN